MTNELRALTVHQPYASLIAHGLKDAEFRSWPTNWRGDLAIHAAARPAPESAQTSHLWDILLDATNQTYDAIPRGALVCVVTISDVVRARDCTRAQKRHGFSAGARWAWLLANVRILDPTIPARGAQSLWRVESRHLRRINAQVHL